MIVIKSDAMKDSGSPFKPMKPEERQLWQDMVNHAFYQFIAVVEEGRPQLKGKLTDVVEERQIPAGDGNKETVSTFASAPYRWHFHRRQSPGIRVGRPNRRSGSRSGRGRQGRHAGRRLQVHHLSEANHARRPVRRQSDQAGSGLVESAETRRARDAGLWYLAPQSDLAGYLAVLSGRGR